MYCTIQLFFLIEVIINRIVNSLKFQVKILFEVMFGHEDLNGLGGHLGNGVFLDIHTKFIHTALLEVQLLLNAFFLLINAAGF